MKKFFFLLLMVFQLQNAAFAINSAKLPAAEINKLLRVVASIHHYYIKPVKNKKLFDNAIAGMMEHLDPHSSFLDEESLLHLKLMTSGEFAGVGIHVLPVHGVLRVISPIDGSPAQQAGIKAGDLIFRIDNKLVKSIRPDRAIALIRGKKGTKVTLFVLRKNEKKPLKFEVTRDNIKLKNVRYKVLDDNYGYIRIALFNTPTKKEVLGAIKKLNRATKNRVKGLIIDLRNNPGGMLVPAVEVADFFLNANKLKNDLIVYTKGYPDKKKRDYRAKSGEFLPGIPIVVLINQGSASAAEIMAGALQDHKRAIIVGTKSFGKGSVQNIIPIGKLSAIKITTALYYTPKGRSIQAEGIKPDVIVANLKIPKTKTDVLVFEPIYENHLGNHLANGKKKEKSKIEKSTSKKLLHEDYQLYEALNLVKGLSAMK